ncbi:MAG: carboxypeptidase regulatory-like domain-containing protein [Oceanicaulis sp.]|nr:carboxypeptidase regulatory-like domain-containing protein [Oceanicaulis sp.]
MRIRAFDSNQSIMIDSTVTSSNGTYSLGLPAGTYQVTAVRPGFRSESLSIPLQIGQNLSSIDFSLGENFALVQGIIEDSDGEPLEDVRVNLRGVSGSGATVSTGSDGSYSISRLTTGSYTLSFAKSDYISRNTTIQIRDGQFVELPFNLEAAAGAISGIVRDINNNPISDAEVFVNNGNGAGFETVSNTDGEYDLNNLPPGTYIVTVSRSGYSVPAGIEVDLSPGNLVVTDANITDLVPNNASVSGIVRNNASNTPLQGVQVSLSGTEGSGSAITNSEGLYTIANLAPGSYTVRFQRENFRTESLSVNLSASEVETRDVPMTRNQGRIAGRVTNQSGSPLAIIPDIIISSDGDLYRTRANSDGFFEVSNLSTGVDYKIETAVFRNGYINAEVSVSYPLGQDVLTQNLTVQVNEGRVEGTTGTSETSVRLLRSGDGSVVSTTQSNADGQYSFTFLPAGDYRVAFSKPGFQFQPAQSNTFSLASDQTLTVNTTSQPNIGEILVRTTTGASTPLGATEVRILSSDNSITRTASTDNTGEVRFSEVPAGITYTVTASRQGFSAVPGNQQVQVAVGSTQNISFDMVASSSNLQGITRRLSNGETNNLGAVTVRARNLSNGVTRQANSNAEGRFAIDGVPAGQYEVIASRSGYISDTLSVNVAQGQTLDNIVLDLEPSLFNLTGRIVLRGEGVEGIEVSLISTTTQTTVSNNEGFYSFNDLPLSTEATDTTVYQVRFEIGGNVYTRLIRATRDNLAQNVSAPQITLPSGLIQATFTDGVQPLSGVNISFGRIGGSTSTGVTGTEGTFTSSNTLRRSSYQLTYTRVGYLTPQSPLQVELPSDTTIVALTARLPYRHTAVDEIRADEAQEVVVTFPSGYIPTSPEAVLSYRKSSESQFNTVSMSIADDTFVGEIPALFSTDDITYFVSITDSDVTYRSSQITRTPLASGILSSFRFTPQIDQQVLRVGDTYQLRLDIADGISQTLNDEFLAGGEGVIDWAEQDGITISESAGTGYTFTPNVAGNYTLSATIAYRGVELSGQQRITVVSDPITELDVRSSVSRIQNTSPLLYSYVATDAQGRRQLLGSALQWAVEPAEAGTISQNGVFRAASDEYIGQANIVLFDSKTSITDVSEPVTVFAEVRANRSYVFSDRRGMILRVPQNSVENTSEITVRNVEPEAVKKYVFLENTTDSYVTSDVIYRFNLSAGAFQVPVDLELPIDDSHRFNEGNKIVAFFDRSDLVWKPYSSNATPDVVNASGITQKGQVSVLAETEPLDIKHLSVVPNPCSPDVAPLRIGYMLTTQAPPAIVNIQIYNMRGELVRTVLRDDLQYQGRYGSRTGIKEITWDGLTDSGTLSRNGRYVIRVHVKDAEKEEVKLIPVVLVK